MTGELVPADADGAARVTRLVRDVAEALTKLATHGTPTQVATYLHAAGFTGVRGEPSACPIRHYLCATVPDMPDDLSLSVTRQRAQVSDEGWSYGAVDMPDVVGAFVRRFDAGEYPDLNDALGAFP